MIRKSGFTNLNITQVCRDCTNLNITQVCRDCKSYYETFKVDINKYYDENGKRKIKTQELFEKFSFICRRCDLLNILSFDKICNQETVLFLRGKDKKISL